MSKVVFDISRSLDGFIAGMHDHPNNPLGDNGMRVRKLSQLNWSERGS